MEWSKYTIKTLTTAEDAISGMLAELGIYGVEIEDNIPLSEEDKKTMFIDILPELPPDDGTAFVSFYLASADEAVDTSLNNSGIEIVDTAPLDKKETLEAVRKGLSNLSDYIDIGEGSIFSSVTRDEDWINNWKEFFKPFEVEGIVIRPSWEGADGTSDAENEARDPEGDGKIVIEIDPGTAFGTGRHETTKLCMGQVKKYLKPGMRVLDAGTGSGILAILAAKLGASSIFGTDIDPIAVEAAKKNLVFNGVREDSFTIEQGNLIEDEGLRKRAGLESFDIVVANILADVIIPMSAITVPLLKKGGIFISSGIIDSKEEEVREAVERHLKVIDIVHLNDWVSIVARKE